MNRFEQKSMSLGRKLIYLLSVVSFCRTFSMI
jgi:hypothetical protein